MLPPRESVTCQRLCLRRLEVRLETVRVSSGDKCGGNPSNEAPAASKNTSKNLVDISGFPATPVETTRGSKRRRLNELASEVARHLPRTAKSNRAAFRHQSAGNATTSHSKNAPTIAPAISHAFSDV